MDNKEEVIKYLKERQFLGDVNFKDASDKTDYDNLINLFKKWCKFLDYPINYNSLYYFFLEAEKNLYIKNSILFFGDQCIICKDFIYDNYYRALIEKGYDKL